MNKPLRYLLAALLSVATLGVRAQHNCGTDHYYEYLKLNDPSVQERERIAFQQAEEARKLPTKKNFTKKIVPVVFHVFHVGGSENISRAQILDEVRLLNQNFNGFDTSRIRPIFRDRASDMEYEFRLATKDPDGNCTDGIVRIFDPETDNGTNNIKLKSVWPTDRYLNIWVVENIVNFSSGLPGIAGYAQFPWAGSFATDGVIVIHNQIGSIGTSNPNNASTVTHEVGHWIGLFHPFQDSCFGGDLVDDTPPCANRNQILPCDYNMNTCANYNFPDTSDLPDQIENYMDYIIGTCQSMFTNGQKSRSHLLVENWRRTLYTQENLVRTGTADPYNYNTAIAACKPIPDFYIVENTACVNNTVQFRNNSFNATTGVTYNWTFDGGTPATATGQNPPVIRYAEPGRFTVKLEASNSNGANVAEKEEFITIHPATAVTQAPFIEDFEWDRFRENGWDIRSTTFSNWQRIFTGVGSAGGQWALGVINGSAQSGARFQITSIPVAVNAIGNATFTFNYAFAQRNVQNFGGSVTPSNDRLIVFSSSDCGQTWTPRWNRAGAQLATTGGIPTTNQPFLPSDLSQWAIGSFALSIPNNQNLMFRFEFRSNGGNNVLIDNINIGFPLSTNDYLSTQWGVKIYPNPSHGIFDVTFSNNGANEAIIELLDITGKLIFSDNIRIAGQDEVKYSMGNRGITPSAGVYLVRINMNGQSVTQKVVVQ